MIKEKLQQIIHERTSELEKYVQTPNAKDWYIQKENGLLASLTSIFNELNLLRYQSLWQEIEEYWQVKQAQDRDFGGIQLNIRLKEKGTLHYLPLNLYENGIQTN
jgi:hypothetical protein